MAHKQLLKEKEKNKKIKDKNIEVTIIKSHYKWLKRYIAYITKYAKSYRITELNLYSESYLIGM